MESKGNKQQGRGKKKEHALFNRHRLQICLLLDAGSPTVPVKGVLSRFGLRHEVDALPWTFTAAEHFLAWRELHPSRREASTNPIAACALFLIAYAARHRASHDAFFCISFNRLVLSGLEAAGKRMINAASTIRRNETTFLSRDSSKARYRPSAYEDLGFSCAASQRSALHATGGDASVGAFGMIFPHREKTLHVGRAPFFGPDDVFACHLRKLEGAPHSIENGRFDVRQATLRRPGIAVSVDSPEGLRLLAQGVLHCVGSDAATAPPAREAATQAWRRILASVGASSDDNSPTDASEQEMVEIAARVRERLQTHADTYSGDLRSGALFVPELHIPRPQSDHLVALWNQTVRRLFPIVGEPGSGKSEEMIAQCVRNSEDKMTIYVRADAGERITTLVERELDTALGVAGTDLQCRVRRFADVARHEGVTPIIAIDGVDEYLSLTHAMSDLLGQVHEVLAAAVSVGVYLIIACRSSTWVALYDRDGPLKASVFITETREYTEWRERYDHDKGVIVRTLEVTREEIPGIRFEIPDASFLNAYLERLAFLLGVPTDGLERSLQPLNLTPFQIRIVAVLVDAKLVSPSRIPPFHECLRIYIRHRISLIEKRLSISLYGSCERLMEAFWKSLLDANLGRPAVAYSAATAIVGGPSALKEFVRARILRTDIWFEEDFRWVEFYDNKIMEYCLAMGLSSGLRNAKEKAHQCLILLKALAPLVEEAQRVNLLSATSWLLGGAGPTDIHAMLERSLSILRGAFFIGPLYASICDYLKGEEGPEVEEVVRRILACQQHRHFAARALAQMSIPAIWRILDGADHSERAAVLWAMDGRHHPRGDTMKTLQRYLCGGHVGCATAAANLVGTYRLKECLPSIDSSTCATDPFVQRMLGWAYKRCGRAQPS